MTGDFFVKYYLDTEFNAFDGELISLALVREDRESIYLVYPLPKKIHPWVKENVIPILWSIPSPLPGMAYRPKSIKAGASLIAHFLKDDPEPVVITDWPDDIRYFCQAIITGPGEMASIPHLRFEMRRVEAYPTKIADAVQHNAWWDAHALRVKCEELDCQDS